MMMNASDGNSTPESLVLGRAEEREALRDAVDLADRGQSAFVLLAGEAGVGKTTLIRDAICAAGERRAAVLQGQCYDRSPTSPYGPWVEIVRGNSLEHRSSIPDLARYDGDGNVRSQLDLFESMLAYLDGMAREQFLVVVLEDLHWADQASLDLLHFVGSRLGDRRILIVASYRDGLSRQNSLYQALPALVRDCGAQRIDLRPFSVEATRELVLSRYGLEDEQEQLLTHYLQSRSDGNPFFIRELLRTLESEKALHREDDRWQLRDLDLVPVPSLVRQVIDNSLTKLGPDLRSALEAGAVIGHEIPFAFWGAVSGWDQPDLLDLVRDAWEAGLLAETGDRSRLRFSHALVRETLYEGLLPPERRQFHLRAAEYLLLLPQPDPDEVAHHLQQAGDDRAIPWLMRSGRRAENNYAWMEAIQRYEAVFDLLGQPDGATQAQGWLAYHIGGLVRFGDLAKCVHYLREAGRLAIESGDELLSGISSYHLEFLENDGTGLEARIRRMEASLDVIVRMTSDDHQRAQKSLAALFPPEVFTDLRTKPETIIPRFNALPGFNVLNDGLNLQRAMAGLFLEALEKGREYVEGVESVTPSASIARNVCRDTYLSFAVSYHGLGKPGQSDEWFDRAIQAFQAVNHHAQLGTALSLRLRHALVYRTDQISERQALQDAARAALATAGGVQKPSGGSLAVLEGHFELALLEGRWDDAEHITSQTLQRARFWERQDPLAALGTLHHLRGETDDAGKRLHAGLPDGPDTAPGTCRFFPATQLLLLGARLSLDSGDLDGACSWLDALDRWYEWNGARSGLVSVRLLRAEFHRASGDFDAARICATQAVDLAGAPRQPMALIPAKRVLGELAVIQGDLDEASSWLRQSLHLADACGAPYERALGLIARARLEVAKGNESSALSLLAAARNICLPLGAQPALQQIERLDGRLSGVVRQRTPEYPAGLSEREVEVLRLVAAGKSNREIASELFLSVRTIERHVSNIYTKIDRRGRAAATSFALQNDLA
ncbi:MAG: AAA family ATPase [Thermomicrobiales bacterium]